jgi:small subunit ribosomal protein S4
MDIYGTGGESLARRIGTPPNSRQHARRRPRTTEYGSQLFEKQKVRAIYGIVEHQLRRYFAEAQRMPGPAGHNFLRLLERRLDNVVYRMGFARSRPMARQLVSHGHVSVNGRRVTIPSFRVTPGDTITLADTAARMPTVVEELEARRPTPRWLEREDGTGRVLDQPTRSDVDFAVDENKIVAYYAR